MAKFQKYVYVVDTDTASVIDIANNDAKLKRRISVKKNPYPENVAFVRVDTNTPILQINTDELAGYYILKYALDAAIVNRVSGKDAIERLVEAGKIELVDMVQ